MSDIPTYFGIEIGGTKLQVYAVSRDGTVLQQRRAKVKPGGNGDGIRATILAEVTKLRKEFEPAAIGVGFGGPVDWRMGRIVRSFHVDGWDGFPLSEWLESRMGGVPVIVENDAKAAAYAEAIHGAGRDHRLVFYSNSGSGVGAGLVIDGELYRGRYPGEMELGHVRLDFDGNTVQDRASGWSIDQRIRDQVSHAPAGRLAVLVGARRSVGSEAQLLTEALAGGDLAAGEILEDAARDYAHGLSHAVHLLHPDVIVLGGGVSLLGEPWRQAVARHLGDFLMEAFQPGPPLVLAALGEGVVPIGAAMLARRRARRPVLPAAASIAVRQWINGYIDAQCGALERLKVGDVIGLISLMRQAHAARRSIFVCGNGGNAASASHFATDLGKGASAAMPHPFRVLALNDNMSWVTAIANDFAYEEIFVRQLVNQAEPGDVLITSSVSGNSPNIVRALEWAREHGLRTVALVGAKRGRAAELAEYVLEVEDTHYGRVEDTQMLVLHLLCYSVMERVVLA